MIDSEAWDPPPVPYRLADIGVIDANGNAVRPGSTAWDAYQVFLANHGVPAPAIPAPSRGIEDERNDALAAVNLQRTLQLAAGVTFQSHVYDSDDDSRANLTAAVTALNAGIPLPDGFTWRTADNIDVPFDGPTLVALAGTMLAYGNACYDWSWQLKKQIAASDNPAAIDVTAGWPT